MQPRLTRSITDRMLLGVCGGLGEYFYIDPAIVRLIFVLFTLTSGVGIPAYVVLCVVMPRQSKDSATSNIYQRRSRYSKATRRQQVHEVMVEQPAYQQAARVDPLHQSVAAGTEPQDPYDRPFPQTGKTIRMTADEEETTQQPQGRHRQRPRHNWRMLGFILVAIGGLILLEQLAFWNAQFILPVLLIVFGVFLLGRGRWWRRRH